MNSEILCVQKYPTYKVSEEGGGGAAVCCTFNANSLSEMLRKRFREGDFVYHTLIGMKYNQILLTCPNCFQEFTFKGCRLILSANEKIVFLLKTSVS